MKDGCMTLRIAINGFGRIGRNVLRALYTQGYRQDLQVVAINDLGDSEMNAHLLRFDTVHGPFSGTVECDKESLTVNGDRIAVSAIRNPAELPWKSQNIDVVFECTGLFTSRDKASAHLTAGARKVIISAPASGADATIVYGVNHDTLRQSHQIISSASCTTNCLAPVAQVLHRELGIESGLMTTIHAYTNDQNLIDVYHTDPYRARSATQSMIPSKTGAAEAVGLVLPELAGKLTGMAVRVPVINVSLVDLTVTLKRETTAEEVNALMKEASQHSKVLGYNTLPLVSHDFNHNPLSSIFDANHTKVSGKLLKVLSWYDNEWAFSNRMLDNCLALHNAE
ncbi:Glyceraldehyde 3-phosphate dehydrogenase, type I [Pseudomonas syringae pv. primulae]|uniref:Glyceraldehyde-3-phosphate dehydrogenase n=2 Tax=Pseudomonas syringae group TaxID=136849 RepID=A0A0P9XSB1_9PSED|nr:Glyceraldehyde 3-phosphate dehydrogenase, type I [Pseudomonas syringae pv. primulae]